MRQLLSALALSGAMFSLTVSGSYAAMTRATVRLHPPANAHMMAIAHTSGTARISYTAHNADIKLTADNLPRPSALHEGAYVLWLVTGMHKVNAGSLKIDGNMAGLHAMTMDVMFNRLVVTAEKSAAAKAPMGPRVLVGTVMHR